MRDGKKSDQKEMDRAWRNAGTAAKASMRRQVSFVWEKAKSPTNAMTCDRVEISVKPSERD